MSEQETHKGIDGGWRVTINGGGWSLACLETGETVASGRTIDGFAHAVTSRFALQATRIAALEAEAADLRQRAERAEREREAAIDLATGAVWLMTVPTEDYLPTEVIALVRSALKQEPTELAKSRKAVLVAVRAVTRIERAGQAGGEGTT